MRISDKEIILPELGVVNFRSKDFILEGKKTFFTKYGLAIAGYVNGGHLVCNSFSRCPWREFDFYVISHMREGHGRCLLENGDLYEIRVGDAIILPPRVRHRYGSCEDNIYLEDSIAFSGPIADFIFQNLFFKPTITHLGQENFLWKIVEKANCPTFQSQLEASLELQKLCLNLKEKLQGTSSRQNDITALLKMVEQDIGKNWRVRDMADFCALSVDQFRRVFVKKTGMIPKEYLCRLKVMHASQMLQEKKCKIHEISKQLGFKNIYYFSNYFKKYVGVSPTLFVKKNFTD